MPDETDIRDLPDERLASLVQKGDKEVFGLLMERYEPKMLRYARKFLFDPESAEDVVQEVFIKAFVNIASFNADRSFSPWLYRIAHNCFINEIKKRSRESVTFFDLDVWLPQVASKQDLEHEIMLGEECSILDGCLGRIGAKYREVLILHYYEGLGYKEIAEVLRIPTATVGVRLNRAKAAVRHLMDKDHEYGQRP